MTRTTAALDDRSFTPRQVRIGMYGCLAIGIVGYHLATFRAGMYITGLAIYWLAFAGFLGVWKGSSVTLYDERHEALEREASGITVGVAGVTVMLVGPALPALSAAGYELPDLAFGALLGWAAIPLLACVLSVALRYRP